MPHRLKVQHIVVALVDLDIEAEFASTGLEQVAQLANRQPPLAGFDLCEVVLADTGRGREFGAAHAPVAAQVPHQQSSASAAVSARRSGAEHAAGRGICAVPVGLSGWRGTHPRHLDPPGHLKLMGGCQFRSQSLSLHLVSYAASKVPHPETAAVGPCPIAAQLEPDTVDDPVHRVHRRIQRPALDSDHQRLPAPRRHRQLRRGDPKGCTNCSQQTPSQPRQAVSTINADRRGPLPRSYPVACCRLTAPVILNPPREPFRAAGHLPNRSIHYTKGYPLQTPMTGAEQFTSFANLSRHNPWHTPADTRLPPRSDQGTWPVAASCQLPVRRSPIRSTQVNTMMLSSDERITAPNISAVSLVAR